mmetsp:Transcript_2147/g.2890  ORF Transcript_2147/g.2890 Transcript_2147/m.2890 type:complete len:112 (+) Transcript_2147:217-552(+)
MDGWEAKSSQATSTLIGTTEGVDYHGMVQIQQYSIVVDGMGWDDEDNEFNDNDVSSRTKLQTVPQFLNSFLDIVFIAAAAARWLSELFTHSFALSFIKKYQYAAIFVQCYY